MSDQLRRWLQAQKYLKSSASAAADVSHLFLDGGIACVPEDMTGAFNNLYALCLHKKEDVLFVVEKKTPVFRMFFDLDMRTERPLDDETILEFVKNIRAAVADFYGDASLTATVCLATDSPSNWDPKSRSWKTGAHVILPDVSTVSADAVRCRDHVLAALQKTAIPKFTTPLETVVDKCVLEKNGMRMIGSHKLVPCVSCGHRAATVAACQACGGRKKVVQRGVYWPRYVVQPDGFPVVPIPEPETLQDVRRWVNDTSLRVRTRPPATPATPAPRSEADEEVLLLGETSSSLTRLSMEPFREGLEAFAKTLPVQFGPFRFTAMYLGGGDDGDDGADDDKVFIVRTTSRYCMNLGRCHRSNNVYFLFSERGAYQMCFCRCQTTEGRKHGLCANFHSPAFPISPPELKLAMFGPSKADERIRPAPPLKTVVSKEFDALMRRYTSAKKR